MVRFIGTSFTPLISTQSSLHGDDLKSLQKLLHWSLKAGTNEAFVWDL